MALKNLLRDEPTRAEEVRSPHVLVGEEGEGEGEGGRDDRTDAAERVGGKGRGGDARSGGEGGRGGDREVEGRDTGREREK